MIRAIFFDFYSVWVPDIIAEYLAQAQQQGPQVAGELEHTVEQYFQGAITPEVLADTFDTSSVGRILILVSSR